MWRNSTYLRFLSFIISCAIISYNCSGYKEITKSEKAVDKTERVYLHYKQNYYRLDSIVNLKDSYRANAIAYDTIPSGGLSVIMFAHNITIDETASHYQVVTIDKDDIYKYSRFINEAEVTVTVIAIAALIVLSIGLVISTQLNSMSFNMTF